MSPRGISHDQAICDSLLVIAEDIAAHAGFGAVVMSVRHSAEYLQVVAVAGDARVRSGLLGSLVPVEVLTSLLQVSEPWGDLRFIEDAASHPAASSGQWSWMEDATTAQGASTTSSAAWSELPWKRENALVAPMMRADGDILGLVSVDMPTSGFRPSERQRLILSVYAHQAERTVTAAAMRVDQSQQVRLAQAARQIVREAGMQHHVAQLLPRARTALLENLGLQQAWIKSSSPVSAASVTGARKAAATSWETAGESFVEQPLMAPAAGHPAALPQSLLEPLSRAAQHCWNDQHVVEFSAETAVLPGLQVLEVQHLRQFLADAGVVSALIVPLGSGETRLGSMLLGRSISGRAWTEADKDVALDIGHDLGRAMVHTLWIEAQVVATEELRQYAEHKRRLMMSMSHELQTPLASIRAHVELIEPDMADEPITGRALGAINRGADRLTKLVNNMLWLARVDDPHRQVDQELVDVVAVVRDVVDDATASGAVVVVGGTTRLARDEVRHLTMQLPDAPVWVEGTRSELVLLCCNLVANAVKYTDDGGHVHVEVAAAPDAVELSVRDDGIGVAGHERDLIFDDFYRSQSPQARTRPGTGLGLSIVKRIVARHRGAISVEPQVRGTTFRVSLVSARTARQHVDIQGESPNQPRHTELAPTRSRRPA